MTAAEQVAVCADRLLALNVAWDPFLASAVGIPEAAPLVPDDSPEAVERLRAGYVEVGAALAAIPVEELGFSDRLTVRMAQWHAELWPRILDSRREEYTVSRYKAWSLPTAMNSVMPKTLIQTAAEADAYLERCGALPAALAGAVDGLRRGLSSGRTPVRRLVEGVLTLVDGIEGRGGPEATLGAVRIDPSFREDPAWRERLADVTGGPVRAALGEMRRMLEEEALPHARSDERPGMGWIPDGEAAYAASVAEHTTTALTPDEVHDLGLRVVAELADEGRALAAGAFGDGDLDAAITRLRDDPSLRFTRSEDILAAARAAFERGQEILPGFIGRLPETACEVHPMPAVEAAQMMQAYYRPGDLATGKPGVFWVNTDLGRGPTRYELETLAAHESVPGHHVQWSMAREVRQSRYRNLTPTTAFIEGWALYCERNAAGLGLFTDELSQLGMWSSQSWRAARLVVDTGLHAKGWSRRRAVEYLMANTATTLENAEGEVDRYIGNPGQALAYMTGLLELRRARADAEKRLGTAFDQRGFHDRLLAQGSPPLSLVPLIVDEWEAEVRADPAVRPDPSA
ncbi:DUF885 domain-containing protein [Microbacterium sp.]|uniref:DUF885 domain-containing protein n=1 Tax=Microbacterium sp. TaxID=51671 RepID=UPI00333FE200